MRFHHGFWMPRVGANVLALLVALVLLDRADAAFRLVGKRRGWVSRPSSSALHDQATIAAAPKPTVLSRKKAVPSTLVIKKRTGTVSVSPRPLPSFLRESVDAGESNIQRSKKKGSSKKSSSSKSSVRFISPLLEYGYRPAVEEYENGTLAEKPLLLYLPGFDGTFLAPFLQFPELGTLFDVRCMTVGGSDRSSYDELTEVVLEYLQSELYPENESADPPLPQKPAAEKQEGRRRRPVLGLFGRFDGQKGSDSQASNRGSSGKLQQSTRSRGMGEYNNRPVYIAGESFGGMLACRVALSLLSSSSLSAHQRRRKRVNFHGLTLVNPATCYDRSKLAADGSRVADLHPLLYPAGLLTLLPMFTDDYSVDQLLLMLQAKALPSVIDSAPREAYLGRVAFSLPRVLPVMTQGLLKWRLNEWLARGCAHLEETRLLQKLATRIRLSAAKNPENPFGVLIVAGEKDKTLPSIAEAERLASTLPGTRLHVVEGAGHSSTCGSRVDLAALFRRNFRELRKPAARRPFWLPGGDNNNKVEQARIAMKPVAAAGKEEYFGMEPRYDNQTIGLSPFLYWTSPYYKRVDPPQ